MWVDVLVALGVGVDDRVGMDEIAGVNEGVGVKVRNEVGTSVGSTRGPGPQAESNKPGRRRMLIRNFSFIFIIVYTIWLAPGADYFHSENTTSNTLLTGYLDSQLQYITIRPSKQYPYRKTKTFAMD